ncbi:hypothetical protein PENTCL1PPCAC_17560, partial [Pristionchus entomophagus]
RSLENVFKCSWYDSLLSRNIFQSLHREGLTRSSLPVCKYRTIVALDHGLHKWEYTLIVDLLGCAVHEICPVESEFFRGIIFRWIQQHFPLCSDHLHAYLQSEGLFSVVEGSTSTENF